MLSGIRQIVRGALRQVVTLVVVLGVFVTPAESLIPDVHDGSMHVGVAAQGAGRSAADARVVMAADDHTPADHGSSHGSHHTSSCGYDHCTHSHVMGVTHVAEPVRRGVIVRTAYAAFGDQPTSFAAPPHVRPPIA